MFILKMYEWVEFTVKIVATNYRQSRHISAHFKKSRNLIINNIVSALNVEFTETSGYYWVFCTTPCLLLHTCLPRSWVMLSTNTRYKPIVQHIILWHEPGRKTAPSLVSYYWCRVNICDCAVPMVSALIFLISSKKDI